MKKQKGKAITAIQHNIATVLLALFSGITSVALFLVGAHDNDYLWHIRTGEYFLENGQLFQTDIFSWLNYELNLQATMHSWLTDVVLALLHNVTQNYIITGAIFCFLTTALFVYVLGRLFYKEHSWFTVVFSFIIGLLCSNPRPQQIGNLFFVLMIFILTESFQKKNYKCIWSLPAISLLWANFHGGTLPMLFAFEGLFVVLGLLPTLNIGKFQLNKGSENCVINFKNIKQIPKGYFSYSLKMLGVLFSSVIAGLANPYGWQLYIYFFVTNDEATKKFVSEWQPGTIGSWYTIVLLALLIVPLVFFKNQVRLERWILPFICFCLGGVHQRILIYGIWAALPLFADILKRFSCKENPYSFRDVLIEIAGFTLLSVFVAFSSEQEQPKEIPNEIISYLQESGHQRLYNTYNDGAELAYYGIPVFVDSRGDLYPGELIEDAVFFETASFEKEGEMAHFLNTYQFDLILLSDKSAATIEYLTFTGEWNRIVSKGGYILFEKRTD